VAAALERRRRVGLWPFGRVPEWAKPLGTRDRYVAFLEVLEEELRRADLHFDPNTLRSGQCVVRIGGPWGDRHELSFAAAAAACSAAPVERWPEILAPHLRVYGKTPPDEEPAADDGPLAGLPEDAFESVRPRLRLQLSSPYVSLGLLDPAENVTIEVADDLTMILTEEVWPTEVNVKRERVTRWGKPIEGVLALARRQSIERCTFGQSERELHVEGETVTVLAGSNYFIAVAVAAKLQQRLERDTVVALPTRKCAFLQPLRAGTSKMLPTLVDITGKMFAKDDALSPHVYLARHNAVRWERLTHGDPGSVALRPEDDLNRLLATAGTAPT
jgi:hypothetical protein